MDIVNNDAIVNNDNIVNNDAIVIAILAKDKELSLPFYLQCIYNQTYNKKKIHLYIRTNDNKDNTTTILKDFIEKYGNEYASIYFNDANISEQLKQYSNHEWNVFRFNILGKIRQDSIDYARDLKAHYFVADCDNFIIPTTIEHLYKYQDGVISPMLRTGIHDKNCKKIYYSNYHYDVDINGYYKDHENYYKILYNEITGLIRVSCIHCTYFIPNKFLSFIKYDDNSKRYEYVIFSDVLRLQNIPQYIDNTHKYGYLTFAENKDEFDVEYDSNKHMYSFV